MNEESQVIFLEYFCKKLQKEANLSIPESMGVVTWFAYQNPDFNKIAEDQKGKIKTTIDDSIKATKDSFKFPSNDAPTSTGEQSPIAQSVTVGGISPAGPTDPATSKTASFDFDEVMSWFQYHDAKFSKMAEDAPVAPAPVAPVAPVVTPAPAAAPETLWGGIRRLVTAPFNLVKDVYKKQRNEITERGAHVVAKDVMNQSGISGIGDFLKGIAPYAVPGILGYLALKATGAESGTAALGGLAAGAIGGSFWKDPANAETVGDIKNWGKNLITPTAVPPAAALTPEQAEAAAAKAKDTANTARNANKLNPPPE